MENSEVKLVRQLSGSVEAVRAVMGVATDDYEALNNKPSINGVVLSGNVNVGTEGVSGLCFYVLAADVGDEVVISLPDYEIETYGRSFQFGDVILSQDKKLFVVDRLNLSGSSSGITGSVPSFSATLFADFSA